MWRQLSLYWRESPLLSSASHCQEQVHTYIHTYMRTYPLSSPLSSLTFELSILPSLFFLPLPSYPLSSLTSLSPLPPSLLLHVLSLPSLFSHFYFITITSTQHLSYLILSYLYCVIFIITTSTQLLQLYKTSTPSFQRSYFNTSTSTHSLHHSNVRIQPNVLFGIICVVYEHSSHAIIHLFLCTTFFTARRRTPEGVAGNTSLCEKEMLTNGSSLAYLCGFGLV